MIRQHIAEVRARIADACNRAGRQPSDVTLVAVAKTFPASLIREALAAGLYDIGENYVQELASKQLELGNEEGIRWHFIGHLQANKVKSVVGAVELIHAVDSVELGARIARRAAERDVVAHILVEVNTSQETSKFGVPPAACAETVRALAAIPGLRVDGLMTIGPFLPDPEASRPAFRSLRRLRDTLASEGHPLPHLSMGMTNDLEVAIEEGATIVRVGTAIFGKRTPRTT